MGEKSAKETVVTVETLIDALQRQKKYTQEDLAFIIDACAFAESHYSNLTHPVGKPYLSFACGIAKILVNLDADADVIAASLLFPPPPAKDALPALKLQFKDKPVLLRLIDELFHLDQLAWDIWPIEQNPCELHASKERRKIVRRMYLLALDEEATLNEEATQISKDKEAHSDNEKAPPDQVRVDPAAEHFQKREKQLANLIGMFFVAVSDFSPLIIKLADHLLLLRLLKDVEQTQKNKLHYKQLASITLTVYAPVADRLGTWQLKSELEDMAFRLLNPTLYKEIGKQLEASKQQREQAITQQIIPTLKDLLEAFEIEATIFGRAKHIYGVYLKTAAKQLAFNQINDLLGIRILVDSMEQCYEAQEIIHTFWQPKTDFYGGNAGRDWIANPKENLYQSLHTTVMIGEKIVEVQIRTYAMHEIAEYGVGSVEYAAHWRYKESKAYKKGKLPREITLQDRGTLLVKLRKVQESMQNEPPPVHKDLLPMQKERLKNRIFVITPKGHVLDFPAGATPLDFAYRIHTDLGHNYIGAKVNDHIVRLDYKLENGQIVELIYSRMGRGPSPTWLTISKDEEGKSTYVFARTRQARHKITSSLNKKQKL